MVHFFLTHPVYMYIYIRVVAKIVFILFSLGHPLILFVLITEIQIQNIGMIFHY